VILRRKIKRKRKRFAQFGPRTACRQAATSKEGLSQTNYSPNLPTCQTYQRLHFTGTSPNNTVTAEKLNALVDQA